MLQKTTKTIHYATLIYCFRSNVKKLQNVIFAILHFKAVTLVLKQLLQQKVPLINKTIF